MPGEKGKELGAEFVLVRVSVQCRRGETGCPQGRGCRTEAGIVHQAEKSAVLREAALLSRPAPGFQSWLLPADPSYRTSVGWVGKKPCSLAGCKQEHPATRHITLLLTPAAVPDAQASPSHVTNIPWGGGDEK